jgi:hypothetical protein
VAEHRTHEASTSPSGELHCVALRFDEFGRRALEAATERQDQSIESLIADACGYFAAEVQVGRPATRLPRFRDGEGQGEAREFELRLPSKTWLALEQEAEAQRAELPRIIEHASLLYLADLDSGRALGRILEPEQPD